MIRSGCLPRAPAGSGWRLHLYDRRRPESVLVRTRRRVYPTCGSVCAYSSGSLVQSSPQRRRCRQGSVATDTPASISGAANAMPCSALFRCAAQTPSSSYPWPASRRSIVNAPYGASPTALRVDSTSPVSEPKLLLQTLQSSCANRALFPARRRHHWRSVGSSARHPPQFGCRQRSLPGQRRRHLLLLYRRHIVHMRILLPRTPQIHPSDLPCEPEGFYHRAYDTRIAPLQVS